MKLLGLLFNAAMLVVLAGCYGLPKPQRGGAASTSLAGLARPATVAAIAQPENPATASSQTVERQETRQEAVPAPAVRITETPTPAGVVTVTEHYGAPTVLTSTIVEKTGTTLGAAQKDSGREIAASLAAMRPVQFAGIVFLALALASFHPAIRVVLGGGKTVPAIAGALGLVLVFGPQLFAGRETLALIGAAAVIVGALLVVRLSHKEGQLDALKAAGSVPGPASPIARK